jgi:nucleotide-binding universal stress UspA family protein
MRSGMESTIFKKIMVATDGSEEVKKGIDSAIEIAKFSNAKMYVVHVIALGFYSITHSTDSEWEKAMKELITDGKKATTYIENVGRAANVEVESVILEGNPEEEIIDFAEKNDIDLIFICTHGMTGITRFLLVHRFQNLS